MRHMKAKEVKRFGEWVKTLGQDMQDNPDRYLDLVITHDPKIDAVYNWMGIVVGYTPRGWEEIKIEIRRNK